MSVKIRNADGSLTSIAGSAFAAYDDIPTAGSDNPVKSGGIFDAVKAVSDRADAIEEKLDDIEDGAQVNIIEKITVNGTEQTVTDKTVALTVMTNAVDDLVNYYKKSETYTQAEVDALIAAIVTIDIKAVDALPTENISKTTIYLVPKATAQTKNAKDEYINTTGTSTGWEKIGDTEIDLSGYVTAEALNTALESYVTTASLTAALADYALVEDIPDVSGFQTKTLATPLTIGGAEKTNVEDALGALNNTISEDGVIKIQRNSIVSDCNDAIPPKSGMTMWWGTDLSTLNIPNNGYGSVVAFRTGTTIKQYWFRNGTVLEYARSIECDSNGDYASTNADWVKIATESDVPRYNITPTEANRYITIECPLNDFACSILLRDRSGYVYWISAKAYQNTVQSLMVTRLSSNYTSGERMTGNFRWYTDTTAGKFYIIATSQGFNQCFYEFYPSITTTGLPVVSIGSDSTMWDAGSVIAVRSLLTTSDLTSSVTSGSTAPITSGGVYSEVEQVSTTNWTDSTTNISFRAIRKGRWCTVMSISTTGSVTASGAPVHAGTIPDGYRPAYATRTCGAYDDKACAVVIDTEGDIKYGNWSNTAATISNVYWSCTYPVA